MHSMLGQLAIIASRPWQTPCYPFACTHSLFDCSWYVL